MAQTMQTPITKTIPDPEIFSREIWDTLCALDDFRMGYVGAGFSLLDIPLPRHIPYEVTIPEYAAGREPFHAAMAEMADQLKKAGY